MRRFSVNIAFMALALALGSCGGEDEAKRKELIQNQINIVERQVEQIQAGNQRIRANLRSLDQIRENMNTQLDKGGARITSAKSGILYLRELTTAGLGESPGKWAVRNPGFTRNLLLGLAFGMLVIWLLWRSRQRQLEQAMNTQINQVIDRVSREQAGEKPKPRTTGPARPKPAPAPEPAAAKPEKKPAKPKPEKAAKKEEAAKKKPAKTKKAEEKQPKKKAAAKKPAKKKGGKKEARKKVARRAPAKKCRVKGCNNKHRSKGFCNKHYQQWRRGTLEEEVEKD